MANGGHSEVERLRYGRARLTVARSGPLDAGDRLSDALDAYAAGEARSTSVAHAFLRARVVEHSPSFSWRNAKLSELIALVTSVSEDPKLTAENVGELAEELTEIRTAAAEAAALEWPAVEPPEPAVEVEDGGSGGALADEAALAEAVAEGPRPRPVAGAYWRRRAAALGAMVAAALAIWALIALRSGDEGRADEYREQAAPAASAIADEMDGVYASFDVYLGGAASGVLVRSVAEAREAIRTRGPALAAPAGDPLDGESEEVRAARAAIVAGADYVLAARRFLDQVERFPGLDSGQAEEIAPALYEETVALGAQADTLEDLILSLGNGTGDERREHFRPQPPDDLFRR